ncbi:MAG: hypothetical protein ACI8QZ_003850 [Chlamydiales bacterium]
MAKQRLLFIERRPEKGETAPAWIAHAKLSKSGRTVYFNGKALKRIEGRAVDASHRCVETDEPYWIANVTKDGADRQWINGDPVLIDEGVVEEYLKFRGLTELDPAQHRVVTDIVETDIEALQSVEHARSEKKPGPVDAATRRKRRAESKRTQSP